MARKAKLVPGQQKLSNFFTKPDANSASSGSSAAAQSPVRAAASPQRSSAAAPSSQHNAAAAASSLARSAANAVNGVRHDSSSSGFSGFRMASTLSQSRPRATAGEATVTAAASPSTTSGSARNHSSISSTAPAIAPRSPARRPGVIALRTDVVGLQFRTDAAAPEAVQEAPLVLQRESWNRHDSNAIQGMRMLSVHYLHQQRNLIVSQLCYMLVMLVRMRSGA